jgi:hypothetical protein
MCGWHSGIFAVGILAEGKLYQVSAGEPHERPGVGDLMHPAVDQEVARQPAGRGMLNHLVDLELVVPRSGLQEEVLCAVLDQVAGRKHVVAVPGLCV